MYITREEYEALGDFTAKYPSGYYFDRLCSTASRLMDRFTTGVDGVCKLKVAFPTDSYAVEAVKNCAAEIISFLADVETARLTVDESRGHVDTAHGIRGKVIASVSSGSESISYATGSPAKTLADSAAADRKVRDQTIRDMIADHLSGVPDANGVNLLYMGRYPGGKEGCHVHRYGYAL